jgi:FkbM family methyltransferase
VRAVRHFLRRQRRVELAYHALRGIFAKPAVATPTQYGFRMAGNAAITSGAFEAEEVELLRKLLPQHDRLVDVGANIGFYSCLARQMSKPVVAVEPLAENVTLLMSNLCVNGWDDTEVVVAGLSDKGGIAEIFGSDTAASLVAGWASRSERSLIRERISLTTLDALLAGRFLNERLLVKVDVEGGECELLKGATKTLSRLPAPTWMIEICLSENFPGGRNPRYVETFDVFFDHGYVAKTVNREQTQVTRKDVSDWAAMGHTPTGIYNYLFSRQ